MSLETQIMAEMKDAMKSKDEAALRGLRAINGQISEEGELKLLQKLVKQRKDSLEIYTQQNRSDLAQKEQEEINIIEKFLPKQLSEAELEDALKAIIATTGASTAADMGKVMGIATKQLAGKADGKTISATVKKLLG
jgi:uncharacterized protein YqeY